MYAPLSLPQRAARQAVACCIACGCALAGGGNTHAKLVEEVTRVPVKVSNAYGKELTQDIVVTLFHDDALPKPYPVLVLGHGRAPDAQGRAALGRARYSANARWLTRLGFLVAVPTRIGYGESGGEDVEDTGDCRRKNYPPGYAAAAAQTLQVLDAVRQRPDVARDKTIILGQSFGGATSIAVAALDPPGVQAAINFAGGGGGNPKTQPQNPCGPGLLERMFAGYGQTARLPTLWIYTENDMYFGPKLPKQWFDAFKAAGGSGDYLLFPANGDDGHPFFTRAPELWQPAVLGFLRAHGYPELAMPKQAP